MVTIKNKKYINYGLKKGEKSVVEAELWVDSSAELPTVDGIEGLTLAQGSIAYAIQSGEMYVMDSTGTWYKAGSGT